MQIITLRNYVYSPCQILYPRLCLGYRVRNTTMIDAKARLK
ncbi:MAG: hypothetical protein RXQ74_02235 [Caldivirga sp.]|jgi:hypothetical protein